MGYVCSTMIAIENICLWYEHHHSDVIMGATASQVTGVSRVHLTVCLIKENIKASLHWPLERTSEFPTQRASNAENVSIRWRHRHMGLYDCISFYKKTSRHDAFRITTRLRGEPRANSGYPEQRTSNAELWCLIGAGLNKLMNMQLSYRWFWKPRRSRGISTTISKRGKLINVVESLTCKVISLCSLKSLEVILSSTHE